MKKFPQFLLVSIGLFFFISTLLVFKAQALTNVTKIKAGNLYKSAEQIDVENVEGDAILAGQTINVTGNIKDNLIAAGNTMQFSGSVDQNLTFAGAGLVINGTVYNDIYAAGAYVVVNGDIFGDARIFANEVYINSKYIGGDLVIGASKAYVSKNTKVTGKEYINVQNKIETSDVKDLDQFNNSTFLSGFQNFEKKQNSNADTKAVAIVTLLFSIIALIIMFVGKLIAYYFVLRIFPVFSENTLLKMKNQPLKTIGLGLIVILIAPFIALVLLISIIGFKLLTLLVILGSLVIFLSQAFATYSIGRWITVKLQKTKTGRLLPLALGIVTITLITSLLNLIPFIGGVLNGFITIILVCWGLGAILEQRVTYLSKRSRNTKVIKEKKK
ncbi:MAG: hypothetical protein WCJ58_08000 [bacterium]